MNKRMLTLVLGIAIAHISNAQDLIRETWSEKPVLHKIDAKFNDESAVIIQDSRRVEYIDEKEIVSVYKTIHKIVHINDD
jgi:hypothetical protein